MNLKRILAAFGAAMILAVGGTTAFAHHGGGHGGRGGCYARSTTTYQTCPYADCNAAETHTHGNDGCYYYGHYEGDGHTHCAPSGSACYGGGYCHNHL